MLSVARVSSQAEQSPEARCRVASRAQLACLALAMMLPAARASETERAKLTNCQDGFYKHIKAQFTPEWTNDLVKFYRVSHLHFVAGAEFDWIDPENPTAEPIDPRYDESRTPYLVCETQDSGWVWGPKKKNAYTEEYEIQKNEWIHGFDWYGDGPGSSFRFYIQSADSERTIDVHHFNSSIPKRKPEASYNMSIGKQLYGPRTKRTTYDDYDSPEREIESREMDSPQDLPNHCTEYPVDCSTNKTLYEEQLAEAERTKNLLWLLVIPAVGGVAFVLYLFLRANKTDGMVQGVPPGQPPAYDATPVLVSSTATPVHSEMPIAVGAVIRPSGIPPSGIPPSGIPVVMGTAATAPAGSINTAPSSVTKNNIAEPGGLTAAGVTASVPGSGPGAARAGPAAANSEACRYHYKPSASSQSSSSSLPFINVFRQNTVRSNNNPRL